jgi:hypothetical protein
MRAKRSGFKMKANSTFFSAAGLALAGCAHAPVQIGKDTYLVTVQGCEMFAPPLSKAIRKANEACAASRQVATILETQVSVQLTCVVTVQYRCSEEANQGSGPLRPDSGVKTIENH